MPDDVDRLALVVAGVQKAGTTSLFNYLKQHPGLAAPRDKELHVFDDERMDWSAPDYSAIDAAFPPFDGRLRFEATPAYVFWPGALDRLRRYNPDIRLILAFRDPIARAWSHWRMERHRGNEHRSFSEAIRATPEGELGLRHHTYVARGFYGQQLAQALTMFDRAQLLLLSAAELERDHPRLLAQIAAFAGLQAFADLAPLNDNAGAPMGEMSLMDADYLRRLYEADMALFASLSGLTLEDWPGRDLSPA